MKIDLSQFRQTFLQESAEHVATMESGLLALRSNPDDEETLNAIFRAAHSIKGGAGSFGLASLVRFTHALENLLDRLRGAEIVASEEVIAALLEAVDVVRALLEANAGEQMPAEAIRLIACIEALTAPQMENRGGGETREDAGEPERRATEAEQRDADTEALAVYRIDFRPDREMFSSGANPIVLLRNVAALGRVSVCELHAEELPALAEIDPGQSYLAWTMEIATHRMRPAPWCLGCPRKPSASEEPHGCSHSAISVLRCWRGLDEPHTSDRAPWGALIANASLT